MLRDLKKHAEKSVIVALVAIILFTSAVSWGKILTQNTTKPETVQVDSNKASNKIKKGMLVFTGMMIVVAEYIQLKDDK
ncbi:MAG: hypothetical protein ABJH05_10725 [Fulvivirga sp.]